jgi:signal transduction histidine kinase
MQTSAVRRQAPAAISNDLEAIVANIAECRREIRRLVEGLETDTTLSGGDLAARLRELAATWQEVAGLTVTVSVVDDLPRLDPAVEVAAYRIAGEAVTNVVKHAQATTCTVSLDVDDTYLAIEVVDDGVGITASAATAGRGFGLRSMSERAEALGGRAEVSPNPAGTGTVLRAWLSVTA